ncbi:MAG: thiosulfate sulfurtransferase GlpE [Hyphomicrobium sp.]|jgi:rhodanese-related sulfurtransferase
MRTRVAFKRIGIADARRLIEGRDCELLILDVRDKRSYAAGHIPAAQSASDAEIYRLVTSQPKQQPVLIYCYHGNASQTYAQTFVDFGFEEVFSLDGGFEHWREAGDLPIAIPSGDGA